ncbi:response regulator [Belliella kenyensis]|uniref:Response regulator n=1 Tax=Belliella kenyensis TaxID=1472724 RepID=A0ABV8ERN9_9BACT|nr:response regulator [Belliella kenyensis]MCH7402263.1 response regulator [Belliella kenyensis]MDN3601779.1 response regulator [Belliella kenyensis]
MKKIDEIWVIDDDPMHIYLAKHCIEQSCIVREIRTYKNGKEAYDALLIRILENKELPNIIFLDINMPIWDGWQFLEEILKVPINEKIPICLLTSSIHEVDFEKANQYGIISKYLIKPVSREKIDNFLAGLS